MSNQANAAAIENGIIEKENAKISEKGEARKVSAAAKTGASSEIRDLILVAILLAAGAVLKLTVASVFSFAGMKPNFIIAMYCLAIILIKPKYSRSLVIGLIAGILCQIPLLNATPVVNIPSELIGAAVCGALVFVPMKIANKLDVNPFVTTFLSTVASGYTFAVIVGLMNGIELPTIFAMYAVMVFGTAAMNAILVQILAPVLRKTRGK